MKLVSIGCLHPQRISFAIGVNELLLKKQSARISQALKGLFCRNIVITLLNCTSHSEHLSHKIPKTLAIQFPPFSPNNSHRFSHTIPTVLGKRFVLF